MSATVVDGVCTFGDLPPEQCGHCRGITTPDVDSARVLEVTLELDTTKVDAAVARVQASRARVRLDKLGRILTQTAAVYDQLAEALHGTRGAGSGDRVTGGGGDDKPMPLQHQVAEHRHLLVRGLRYWVAKVHATPRVLVSEDVARMVAWLVSERDQLTEEQQAELVANMLDWQRRARVLTDLPMLRGTIPLGPKTCPGGIEGLWTCDGSLAVLLPADKGNPVALRCADCGGRWDVADLPEAANVRLSLSDAAAVTGTSVRTLQYRVQHGSLPARAGTVLLGDVLRNQCAL